MKRYQYTEEILDQVYHKELMDIMNKKGALGYRVIKIDTISYYDNGSRTGRGDYKLLLEREIDY
jgi:hypothetical protein